MVKYSLTRNSDTRPGCKCTCQSADQSGNTHFKLPTNTQSTIRRPHSIDRGLRWGCDMLIGLTEREYACQPHAGATRVMGEGMLHTRGYV